MSSDLTRSQERVLTALRQRLRTGAPPPTYRELCSELGWRSTGTIRDHLKALARKGLVLLAKGRARLTQLREETYGLTAVPILGRVTAGVPATAEEHLEGMVAVPAKWVGSEIDFAVQVVGDSMEGIDINDGDIVLVRKQSTAHEGDVVVATLDGETTLKRLRKRGNRTMLVAENPRYKVIEVKT